MVLHEDRQVLEDCHQRLMPWLAEIGLTLHEAKSRISHPLEGDQPGLECVGVHIRQYRVGKPRAGQGPGGQTRLGFTTLIKPAKANLQEHFAELGRVIRRGKALPQGAVLRQLHPTSRGWANDYRTGVSQAAFDRRAHLTWKKLRSWAHRRHPNKPVGWVMKRSWHRRDTRVALATSPTAPDAVPRSPHREVVMTRHVKVTGHRSPSDGDGVYWRTRQGRHPSVSPRLAKRRKGQRGRWTPCARFFQHDDRIEIEPIRGDRRAAREANWQARHGHGHDAKTREYRDDLPRGMRDKRQDTEERRDAKGSCAVLEQR